MNVLGKITTVGLTMTSLQMASKGTHIMKTKIRAWNKEWPDEMSNFWYREKKMLIFSAFCRSIWMCKWCRIMWCVYICWVLLVILGPIQAQNVNKWNVILYYTDSMLLFYCFNILVLYAATLFLTHENLFSNEWIL